MSWTCVPGRLWGVASYSVIACHHRAAEWRHKQIELAAHDLLQLLDAKTG